VCVHHVKLSVCVFAPLPGTGAQITHYKVSLCLGATLTHSLRPAVAAAAIKLCISCRVAYEARPANTLGEGRKKLNATATGGAVIGRVCAAFSFMLPVPSACVHIAEKLD
jgi:ABC-type Fe3+ transport system permease subunit